MHISVRTTVNAGTKHLNALEQKQLPFAMAKSLTDLGRAVKAGQEKEIGRVFDKPTPYTRNSLFSTMARKDNLFSVINFKDSNERSAGKYLSPQIEGGTRKQKGMDQKLISAGVMPRGYYAMPGRALRLDQYGNISRFEVGRLIAEVQRQGGDYFALGAQRGKLPPGIYKRRDRGVSKRGEHTKGTVLPMLVFVKQPTYDQRFRYFEVAQRVIDHDYAAIFDEAFAYAIRTAK